MYPHIFTDMQCIFVCKKLKRNWTWYWTICTFYISQARTLGVQYFLPSVLAFHNTGKKMCSQIMDDINSLHTNLKWRESSFYGFPFCTTMYFLPRKYSWKEWDLEDSTTVGGGECEWNLVGEWVGVDEVSRLSVSWEGWMDGWGRSEELFLLLLHVFLSNKKEKRIRVKTRQLRLHTHTHTHSTKTCDVYWEPTQACTTIL